MLPSTLLCLGETPISLMLKEDQAAELLARTERLLGRRLVQIRENLRRARTPAAAVWDLRCIDAFSQVGEIEHEPPVTSAPDIVLHGIGDSPIWIEVGYLYPRYWENERRARVYFMPGYTGKRPC